MRSNLIVSILFSVLLMLTSSAIAQDSSIAPGTQVRNLVLAQIDEGDSPDVAASEVSQIVLDEGLFFDATGMAYLQDNQPSYQTMVGLLNENATGFELAIAGFGVMPDVAQQVVTIAIMFFPENANEIYNIALQMQMLNEQDALLAAISAGIDPSTLTATAAGGVGTPVSPLGVGTGAAGAGGGDTTVSTN